MTYSRIRNIFDLMFPELSQEAVDYRPQNVVENSIHLFMRHGPHLVFTFANESDWTLETYGHFKITHQDISFDFKY